MFVSRVEVHLTHIQFVIVTHGFYSFTVECHQNLKIYVSKQNKTH